MCAWEQHGGVGVGCAGAVLLVGDLGGEPLVDWHDRLATHLVVSVAQVSRPCRVPDEAVDSQTRGVAVGSPVRSVLDQQADAQVIDAVEIGGSFELVHHELRDCPWQRGLFGSRAVVGIKIGIGRQWRPTVLTDRLQKPGHCADVTASRLRMGDLGGQRCQVVLQAWAGQLGWAQRRRRPGVSCDRRFTATRSRRTWVSPIPHDSRHRHHRLVSSRSHDGCSAVKSS